MLKLEHIYKSYDKPLFEDFNLEIEEGKITCLLGESGAGKTTLLRMISKLTDYKGYITPLDKVSYIFQENRLIPHMTIYENLKFICPLASEEEIQDLLTILEIEEKKNKFPKELSGGEAKRVSIARAFLFDAEVILMDEPFASLDLALKVKLIKYFSLLWKKNKKTVIFVTHDVDEALLLAEKIYIIKSGKIYHDFTLSSTLPRDISDEPEFRSKIISKLLEIG
ncbi:MAG TPA: ATP-binding cassette domain-containing protein [Candidatus Pelethenecus sp.]|nr:ATP-binding cassette domain-containing protein [Candidatus Pelethenecus sp.]